MKKYKNIILGLLLFCGMTSCSNFLNVTPKNVISMDDLESIKQSLGGFLSNIRDDKSGNVNSLSIWSPFITPVLGLVNYTEEWDLSKFIEDEFTDSEIRIADWRDGSTASHWNSYYSPIGFMNLIIHEALKAEGDEDMRNYVLGEAYTMRAYCFFKLLQYFSPYKDNELGIPICLETYEDFEKVSVRRHTQQEVYQQILKDLNEAVKCLELTPTRETYNLMYRPEIINRLYAQIYCFKAMSAAAEADDWANAIAYADLETKGKELDSDPTVLSDMFSVKNSQFVRTQECPLRARTYGGGYSFSYFFTSNGKDLSQTFYRTYFPEGNGDIRRSMYYNAVRSYDYNIGDYVYNLRIDKFKSYSYSGSYYLFCGFRLAETFLIQAEAYVRTDKLTEAKAILKRFKEARYTEPFIVPDTKEQLLDEIIRERKKEFVAEGDYCWMDMKRLGMKAERTIGDRTFKLEGEGDYRYTFPIPDAELKNNKEIEQNPGWIENNY